MDKIIMGCVVNPGTGIKTMYGEKESLQSFAIELMELLKKYEINMITMEANGEITPHSIVSCIIK